VGELWEGVEVAEQRLSAVVHDLLVHRVATAGPQPLLVHRDEAAGTRVELSAVSLTNTVAKASALFEDERGGSLALAIPPHWIGAALALAGWHMGLHVWIEDPAYGDDYAMGAEVSVVGPKVPTDGRGETSYATRLHPFGLPYEAEAGLPAVVNDLALELRLGPDVLGPPAAPSPWAEDMVRENALIAAARTYTVGLGSKPTLVSALPFHELRGLLAATLVPLLTGGSTVLVTGTNDADDLARIAATERATATWATG
jgi:uncharacterized protein (TIGR03089 family)